MHSPTLTLRIAEPADSAAIARLAELEEAAPLAGETLIAERDGAIVAALAIDDGRAVADIFLPTAGIVRMLGAWRGELRAARTAAGGAERRRRWSRGRAIMLRRALPAAASAGPRA
jgi:hypothetical protein